MASSGTRNFNPQLADLMDEAFELAGLDPAAVGNAQITGALRSLRLMLNSEWATIGIRRWMVATVVSDVLATGAKTITLPAGTIDVLYAVLRRAAKDTEMYRVSREEYLGIVDKDSQGRPDRFWVDRQPASSVMTFWQCTPGGVDRIVYDVFRHSEDVGESLQDNLAIPQIAHHAMTMGLAARIALKWNGAKFAMLQALYRGNELDPNRITGALGALIQEERERGDIELTPHFAPRTGRRW